MKQIQHLKNAIIFRSKENAHRYFYLLNGKLCSFVTDQKDALSNLAAMFGNLNAGFSTTSSQFVRSAMLLGALGIVFSSAAYALPTGYESAAGNVQFNQSNANTLNVTTQAARSIANYRTFNINHGETVNFILPGSHASILNRVTGGSPSQIFGAINSNGQVFLVNPSGILFGSTAQVNVGALFASTQSISNQDFLNGKLIFKQDAGLGPASVVNQGNITTQKGGYVVLAGAAVQNSGNITAPQGQVNLAVGDQISMVIGDNMAVQVTVDEALKQKVEAYQDAISNTGSIKADGGAIQLQAELQDNLYTRLVNNEGLLQAQAVTEGADGSITLLAHADAGNGLVRNAGIVDASGTASAPNAGKIALEGDRVIQRGQLLAEGAEQGAGGTIAIKSLQGTLLADGSLASVRGAGANSNAGRILINSDQNTYFRSGATLDASGGSQSGNGGFVEVSGQESVYFDGVAKGGAVNGKAGSILIDPKDIIISNGGANSVDVTAPDPQADVPGGADETFTESAGQTVTYNPQAAGTFNGFGDIHLQATNNITVNSLFDTSIATGNPSVSLKLEARNNININANVTTQNAALDLIADADANGAGDLNINAALASNNGNITLRGNQLNLTQSVDAGTGTVTLAPVNNARSIALGGATGSFDINNAELNQITASNLVIGTDLQSGRINIGSANLSAKATDLTLKTTGTITDNNTADDSVANILLAADHNLAITGGVGGIGSGMIGVSSGLGDINITTAGTGSVSITTNNAALAIQDSSNLLINNISAGSGDVTLRSSGMVQDLGGVSGITNTGSLTLTSNGGIGQGAANPLDVSTGNISVTSTGGNDISIRENGPMTVKSINTGGAGTVRLASNATIDDTQGGDAITTTGDLILSSNGAIGNGAGDHVGTNIGGTVQVLTTGGNDVRLSQTGNLVVNNITTGGAGEVELTASGSITDTGAAPSIVTTGGLTLTSKGVVGSSPASPLDITVGSVTVKSTDGNDINLHSTNPLLIADINTGDTGNINLRSDATIANAGAIGSIITKGSLTLSSNGTIGSVADPLRLQVGQLNVTGSNGNDIALSGMNKPVIVGDISTGGTGDIALLATTSIQDGGAGEHIHTTGSLTLTAGNNIGTDANPLGIDVGQVSVTSANTVNLSQTANMVVNSIVADAEVTLQSGGSITDTGLNAPSITTPGHLTLTSNGAIGNGAASPLDTQVGILSVNSTGGNDIAISSTGPLKFQSIQTGGAGNILLASTSTIGDNAVGDTITTTGTVTFNSSGAIGSVFNPIGLNTGNLTITGTGGNDVFLNKTGDLTIDSINTGGAGNVNLSATGGIFGNGGGIHVTTDGSLNLLSNGAIGGSLAPLRTHIGGLNILGTGNNDVFLLDDHTLNISSVLAGNGVVEIGAFGDLNLLNGGLIQGSDILLGALGGGMNLNGNVGEAGNTIFSTLVASNTIQGTGTVFADFIDIYSDQGNIGNSLASRLNTNGQELTLNAPNGSVYINHFGGGVDIVDDNTALNDFAVTTVEPGDITVDGTINAGAISLVTTGSSIFINNNITGNNSVLLSAAKDGDITGPGLISGNNVTLTAVNGNIIANTNATALAVNTLGSTVNITESNSVNLANSSSGGTFTLTTGTDLRDIFDPNSVGTVRFIGETVAQNINISAAGDILSDTNRGNNIRATGDSTLIANGIIGTLRHPIRVNVQGGTLSVAANRKKGPYSGVLVGRVRPSNSLNVLNNPPGIILFNGLPQPAFDPSQVLAALIYPYKYSADPNYVSTAQTVASLTTPTSILNTEANIINEVPTEQPFDLRLIEESAEPGAENGPVNYLLIDTTHDEEEKKRLKELRQ